MALEHADERHPELERARKLSRLLDDAVRVPGTDYRIGIDPILGVLPVQGDLAGAALSLYIVLQAERAGLPREKLAGMLAHIGAEFLVGSIPILGTVIDAGWKVNERNVAVMEEYLEGETREGV